MKWRIWLLSLGITFACLIVFSFAATQVYYQSSIDDSKEYLRVYMNEYTEEFTLDEQGASAFSEKLNGARVTFMDAQGNVLADSLADHALENHYERSEIKDAIFRGEGFAVRGSSTFGKNMVYYCKNFDGDFLVRIAIFTDTEWTLFAKSLPILLYFSLLTLVLCGVIAIVSTHFILTPVKKLATEATANPNVTSKYSELEPVAQILNERSRNIQRHMESLEHEKELVLEARAAKDEFIANVTHEMNTPLTSIRGYAELLQAGGLSEEQKDTAYDTILVQSGRLSSLIACIINYSQIEADDLPPYEVDFTALARETIEALRPVAEQYNVRLIAEIEDNIKVTSRNERIREILGNLTRNAIKYNKPNGEVRLILNYNQLIMEDTGIGIAEENRDKVFSRFFTVDKSHGGKNGGFGLGLAVVKKICQKSGWQLTLESELGVGSRFTITFA